MPLCPKPASSCKVSSAMIAREYFLLGVNTHQSGLLASVPVCPPLGYEVER